MSAPHPWQTRQWRHLITQLDDGKLGHAYLLNGPAGLGKYDFALAYAKLALCEARTDADHACGVCRSCELMRASTHPDLKLVSLQEERKTIGIDQIRELIEFYTLTSHYGRHKIALVAAAERITAAAANALLKVLEEPPAGALFLLVANRPGMLPVTLRSRCQQLGFAAPDRATTKTWLRDHLPDLDTEPSLDSLVLAGAPLAIVARLTGPNPALLNASITLATCPDQAPLELSRALADTDPEDFVDSLEITMYALLLLKADYPPPFLDAPQKLLEDLHETADKLNFRPIFEFLDHLGNARAMLARSTGLRGADVIESLCFAWTKTARRALTESSV